MKATRRRLRTGVAVLTAAAVLLLNSCATGPAAMYRGDRLEIQLKDSTIVEGKLEQVDDKTLLLATKQPTPLPLVIVRDSIETLYRLESRGEVRALAGDCS